MSTNHEPEAASYHSGGTVLRRRLPDLRAALILWAVIAVAVSIKTLVSPDDHTVFPKLAARGLSWWEGRSLYDKYGKLGRFPYSPTFAVALTPFSVLGLRLGGIAWSLVNIAVYVWGLRRLVRDVLPGSWPEWREATLLMLAAIGAIRGIWNAQSNALIIGLLMVGVSGMARGRWWRAAAFMTGAVYLKVWPIVIPLLVMALKPRRFSGPFVWAMIMGAAIPFLTQWPSTVVAQYQAWFAYLKTMSQDVVGSYRDLATVMALINAPIPPGKYVALQLVTGLGVLAWCIRQKFRLGLGHTGLQDRDPQESGSTAIHGPAIRGTAIRGTAFQAVQHGQDARATGGTSVGATGRTPVATADHWLLTLTLAMGSAWLMILGPAVEYNTYVVLAPTLSWALMVAYENKAGRIVAGLAFAMTMVLGAGAVERALEALSPVPLFVLPAGTLLFVIWLVIWAPRCQTRATSD